ncbi:MAG: hypothetical protein ACLPIX_21760 [Rhodomicrobium sp.]
MDNHALEQRITQLERKLAFWEAKFKQAGENDSIRFVKLELQVEYLMSRLEDFDRFEKIVSAAYVKSHPKAQEAILEIDRTVDMGAQHLYFENFPSIKDARSKS